MIKLNVCHLAKVFLVNKDQVFVILTEAFSQELEVSRC